LIAYKFTYNSSSRQQQIIVATNSKGGSGGGIGEGSVYTNIWVCHYFGCYFAAQDVAVFFYTTSMFLSSSRQQHSFLLHTSRAKQPLGKALGKKDIGLPKGNTSLLI